MPYKRERYSNVEERDVPHSHVVDKPVSSVCDVIAVSRAELTTCLLRRELFSWLLSIA